MGTSRTTLAGSARAKKIGTDRKAGVARSVRKRRSSNSTKTAMVRREKVKKMLEPTGTGSAEDFDMVI